MPKISVIIPMYNAEKYIGLAISSVLAQQFGDFELILINDASTDRTLAIAAGVDDPRVKIINSENNLGGGRTGHRAQSRIGSCARRIHLLHG